MAFTTVPPPQKYLNIFEIFETYGSLGVVAYHCKIGGLVPQGGFVVATQENANSDISILKTYREQFATKFTDKKPVYYFRLERPAGNETSLSFTFDDGKVEKTVLIKEPQAPKGHGVGHLKDGQLRQVMKKDEKAKKTDDDDKEDMIH
jgi:hypothetical protein